MNKVCANRNCKKEVSGRKKYCSDFCKYWEGQLRKDNSSSIGWGEKQMRLDKKERRFGERIRKGRTGVRYN